jgi:hypothetical protein
MVLSSPELHLGNLGEAGWLKVLKLDEYASRKTQVSLALQKSLLSYTEVI